MSTLTSDTTTIEAPGTTAAALDGTDAIAMAFQGLELTGQPAWLQALRRHGLERFQELGFPTLHHEDWRFTNLEPVTRLPFRPAAEAGRAPLDLKAFPFAALPSARLVFVDGHHAPVLSNAGGELEGATVMPLAEALDHPRLGALAAQHVGRLAGQDDNPFGALNNAFFTDGLFVHVPAGISVPQPVHLLHITTTPGAAVHPRLLVVAEANSRLTLLETHVSTTGETFLNNSASEVFVGENATVEHCKFQDDSMAACHFGAIHSRLDRASHYRFHSISAGAALSRNQIRTLLDGEGVACILNGLYLTRDRQLADHHMVVNHAKPRCESHEYFNGILADQSRGVFHGRILVQQAAQKTDAKQTNKNLLLSDDATANTKPQLEIYADDVKCTHGATIGQLNDESIFYLRARGISQDTARRMLIHAFAGEIIERVECDAIREELDQLVWDRLEEHEAVSVRQNARA